jgi:hypothetical protein
MNPTNLLLDRLTAANPGWREWGKLATLVKSLSFEEIADEYLGSFFTSDHPLTFAHPTDRRAWPDWLPKYVPALFGMKADDWEMAGGYADSYYNELAVKGAVFSPAGNDEELGFPLIDVPPEVYNFQSNSSGALFFINRNLEVLYPNSDDRCFEKLDTLEKFTRKNIKQALAGETWFQAYAGFIGTLLD